MKVLRVGRVMRVMSLMLSWLAIALLAQMAWGQEVPRMTKEELKPLLGDQDVIIMDVRVGASWSASQWKIQGAIREDPRAEIATWASKYPKDKTIVLYCS